MTNEIFRTLDLPGGTLVPFPSVPGERVRILYGRIWLTEEGSTRDAFLASGEEVALGTRGLAVIEALGPTRIQLIESAGVSRAVLDAARRVARSVAAWWLRQVVAAIRRPRMRVPLLGEPFVQIDSRLCLVHRVEMQSRRPRGQQSTA